jgi:hypothetical protein
MVQAEYVIKVQEIRSKGQAPRYYVSIPLPLAAALELQGGEEVQWQLHTRSDLRLLRLKPAQPKKRPRRKP